MKNASIFTSLSILFIGSVSASRMDEKLDSLGDESVKKEETVVLVHGQGRTRFSMIILEKRFASAGFQTLNFPYNQSIHSFDAISSQLIDFIKEKVKTKRYHLIGHSLGSVIIRDIFRKDYPKGLGKVVMLAPPNRPAHLAKLLKGNPIYRWATGDSGQKLSEEEFYNNLPIPLVPFGVIAGDKGQKLTFSEPNDGVVTVESTKLEGMADWVLLNHGHTFIMNCRDTFEYSLRFLETGSFQEIPKDASKKGG